MSAALVLPLLILLFGFFLVVGWLQLAKGANPAIATGTLMFFLALVMVLLATSSS